MSAETFSPYNGKGAVNASYHWVRSNNQEVVKDGDRSELSTLEPNQSAIVPIRVQFPNEPGEYILKLTLVQEGCNWFYLANPDSVFNIPYKIR